MTTRKNNRGYTLIEILIVMGIIILALSLAIPTIRGLTGAKSEQAAQNTVSAFIAQARAEAVGLQRPEGVMFYIDPATDRVNLAEVYATVEPNDPAGVTMLDLVPNRDTLKLPPGIRAWTVKDNAPSGFTEAFRGKYRYLGYNSVSNNATSYGSNTTPLGGVILFDGNGRLLTGRYGFRYQSLITGNPTGLGQMAFTGVPSANWPAGTQYIAGQIAFVLFDRETFLNQVDGSGSNFTDANTAGQETNMTGGTDKGKNGWLDTNTTPIFVNRYSGTLIRVE